MASRYLRRAVVDLPEGQVHLRAPSALTAFQVGELEAQKLPDGERRMLELLLRDSICDQAGELLYSEDASPLRDFSVEQLTILATRASELMGGGSAAAAKGTPLPNAPGGPSAA